MRKQFAELLLQEAVNNERIVVVTADLGYGMWDEFRAKLPSQFYNVGASEQFGSDFCVGLALSGKIPVFYSITPFLIYRCFETLRTYIDHENIPMVLVGSGRDKDYAHDGFSHDASDDHKFMAQFDTIESYWPELSGLEGLVKQIPLIQEPWYINLKR